MATQATAKTRSSQFGVGNFQTPSSFSPMSLPGASTASPGAAAYPSLTSRGSSFGKFQMRKEGNRKMTPLKRKGLVVKIVCLCPGCRVTVHLELKMYPHEEDFSTDKKKYIRYYILSNKQI